MKCIGVWHWLVLLPNLNPGLEPTAKIGNYIPKFNCLHSNNAMILAMVLFIICVLFCMPPLLVFSALKLLFWQFSSAMIKQFLTDVVWGARDYLIIDTPPGTSDEHITVVEQLKAVKPDGAILVSTPQVWQIKLCALRLKLDNIDDPLPYNVPVCK